MAERVHVVFVDATTGVTFAETDTTTDRLPATFAEQTTMHLGDEPWFVVRAEPVTAAEFARTGHLRLEMQRVMMMDPKAILFSLPTISNELPACEPVDAAPGLVLLEDDWRQIELITEGCSAKAEECLAHVKRIYRDHRQPSGAFDALHVRREVPEPLHGAEIALRALVAQLARGADMGGVLVHGQGRVRDGFALQLPGGVSVYGLAPEGRVQVLGLVLPDDADAAGAEATALTGLMKEHHLILVDWCRAAAAPADREAVLDILQRR